MLHIRLLLRSPRRNSTHDGFTDCRSSPTHNPITPLNALIITPSTIPNALLESRISRLELIAKLRRGQRPLFPKEADEFIIPLLLKLLLCTQPSLPDVVVVYPPIARGGIVQEMVTVLADPYNETVIVPLRCAICVGVIVFVGKHGRHVPLEERQLQLPQLDPLGTIAH